MFLFWISYLIFVACFGVCQPEEISGVGLEEMMRYQAEADIEALRKMKERAEQEERERNSLVQLADDMFSDTFQVHLQTGETHPLLNVLYDNSTDLKKELKFTPVTYNCGRDFDIYKLLEQAKGNRRLTTQCPKCVEEVLLDGSTETTVTPKCNTQNTVRNFSQASERNAVSTSASSVRAVSTTTTTRQKLLKKLDGGKKVSGAVVSPSAGKEQKQESQGLRSLFSGKGLHGIEQQNQKGSQQVVEPLKVNVSLLTLQSTVRSVEPTVTNKPLGLMNQFSQGKPTSVGKPVHKAGIQPQSQLQDQDSPYYLSDESEEFKNPNNYISDQKSFYDDEKPLKIDNDKMPQIEYVYSEQ